MMMALAGMRELLSVLVPGGVTLPSAEGEDAGKVRRSARAIRMG
jgi:xylonate dehydratase